MGVYALADGYGVSPEALKQVADGLTGVIAESLSAYWLKFRDR